MGQGRSSLEDRLQQRRRQHRQPRRQYRRMPPEVPMSLTGRFPRWNAAGKVVYRRPHTQ
ncbi:MAG: hypothetical protein ACOX1G_04540 [bacterium]